MGKKQSLRSKAVHLVSDLTTVLLNPISDHNKPSLPSSIEEKVDADELNQSESEIEGPDTSSFTAFLYSFLSSSSDSGDNNANDDMIVTAAGAGDDQMNEKLVVKKGLLSRGRQSLGKAIYLAARVGGFPTQDRERDKFESDGCGVEMKCFQPSLKEVPSVPLVVDHLPEISEPSMLISNSLRNAVYDALPALIHGKKWLMMYSTWKHGISLSTLYRRSMLWPGPSLLVVGDRKGAVFGGLVEAPLRPSNKKKYQGTNSTFVFTNISGHPVVYRPTGVNRYFTLCTTDFLAIGGGGHFALYLEGDLLNGSSSVSETYGNPCLAHSPEFQVKEVELWGSVFPSKYEEILKLSRTEAPGISRW